MKPLIGKRVLMADALIYFGQSPLIALKQLGLKPLAGPGRTQAFNSAGRSAQITGIVAITPISPPAPPFTPTSADGSFALVFPDDHQRAAHSFLVYRRHDLCWKEYGEELESASSCGDE